MNREEAFKELNSFNLTELFMADMEKHVPADFEINLSEMFQLFNTGKYVDEKLMRKILGEMNLRDPDKVPELITAEREGGQLQHYENESYSLTESRKISLVKHDRYSHGVFHDHEFFEMAYLFTGSCSHTFRLPSGEKGDMKEETTVLYPGELVIIPPGLTHKVVTEGESLMVNILIHRQTFQSAFLAQLPENNTLYHFFAEALLSDRRQSFVLVRKGSRHLADLILDMYIEEKNQDNYTGRMQENLLQMFFLELLRSNEKTMILSDYVSEKEQLTAAILLFIENNYRRISLADVADQFHFSKAYLNRIFRETEGQTILKKIKELRMAEAAKLLKDRSLSVAAVGEMVGYQDTSYFIEEYRKTYGRTPRADREITGSRPEKCEGK